MLSAPKKALALIEGYEGTSGQKGDRFFAVQEKADRPGVLTVGRGHVVTEPEKLAGGITVGGKLCDPFKAGLTLDEIDKLFDQDVQKRLTECAKHARYPEHCTEDQFAALLCFWFNYPKGIISGSLGTAHRAQNKAAATRAFLMYIFSSGKRQLGLWRRRGSEALLYATGEVYCAKSIDQEGQLFKKLADAGYTFAKPKDLLRNGR